ncbi:hypothetical protein N7481_008257 [Penicillium waksmanii]|uniref:uncharacterized protein n=1 Tax=Penicillium waksmanii TaxID=69791 RepID=UPI0025470F0D|nr:uncharacterized protein N7481_008257 [Penicillium waksmanii]KAJ5980959.1 hypothetical protein N7481_008257 [Penicillium waksmanii]
MARHRVSAPAQQPVLKGTFYDPVSIEYAVGNQSSRKPEPAGRPNMASDGKTNEQNPSIARSMSRYRRNRRPTTSGDASTPTPAVPDRARNQPVPPVPDVTSQTPAAEEHVREQHRLDAMAQLTGGDQSSRPAVSRYEKQEKQPQAKTKAQPVPTHQQTSRVDTRSHHDARPASGDNRKSLLQKMKLSKSSKTPLPNEPWVEGGIVPGTDAPVSAVNAGERQVLVQYSDVSNHLVVTPSTRVNDLLQTAVRELSRDIDPEKFICIESFHQVGLERSLRRYERVRDIMNSWAHDADNRLVIVPPLEHGSSGPTGIPSSPRRKTRRNDLSAICPTLTSTAPVPVQWPKRSSPPKKICFAIKSQQKSSMFLSTEKFVHFFSSNDRATADKWFRVVQRWRSWYLVNQLGAAEQTESEATLPKRSLTQKGSQRHRKAANDVPVPLLDLTDPEPTRPTGNSIDRPRPSTSKDIVSRKKTVREHASPPPSFPQTLSLDTGAAGQADDGPLVQGVRPDEVEAATFSPTGLLGRSYTQRKQALNEREEREKRANQELFAAQSFLTENHTYSPSDTIHQQSGRTTTMTGTAPPGLSRNKSVSQKQQQQKPLIDLTPVFQEPPQHTRKGRGVKVGAGTQLIDAATGPELAVGTVNIPPATAWRRPTNELPTQSRYRSNTARSVRHGTEPKPSNSGSAHASPASPSNPFVSNTLLANSASRQASSTHTKPYTGHGVATGDRNATRPMLDMSPENPFAEGSLLRQL